MSLIAGLNPWIAMWNQPRSAIRAIAHSKPSYGVYYLAAIYALQSFFFYANWWSLGLNVRAPLMLALGVVLSPLLGAIWLYFMGYVYYLTGRLLKGRASPIHLRAVVAWSFKPFPYPSDKPAPDTKTNVAIKRGQKDRQNENSHRP